jgi:hypothetical protein
MRRVIIGTGPDGRAVVSSDAELPRHEVPETAFTSIWEADVGVTLPSDGSMPQGSIAFFPPPGGLRVVDFVIPPLTERDLEGEPLPAGPEAQRAATMPEGIRYTAGLASLHATDTVDVLVVLSGETHLVLDTGEELRLLAGDWLVQNGAFHRWENRSDAPCRVALMLIGATTGASR